MAIECKGMILESLCYLLESINQFLSSDIHALLGMHVKFYDMLPGRESTKSWACLNMILRDVRIGLLAQCM